MNRNPKIILALDVDSFSKAKHFVDLLYPKIRIFKVGLQLFLACGPKIIDFIHKKGAEVFLDLKFFDIPNTVAKAVRQALRLKVKMLTLHIAGGEDMLKAAVKAAKEEALCLKLKPPLLIGVTVLTSQQAAPKEVVRLAKTGMACGLDGVVCSAQEAKTLARSIKKQFVIITPGIRPSHLRGGKWLGGDDQKRTATVQEALSAGSDFLVIGRPIIEANDPLSVLEEMARGYHKGLAILGR